jgi:hypothetical protein
MTLAQLNAIKQTRIGKPTQNPAAEARRDFALTALVGKLEKVHGLTFQGRWPKTTEKRTLDVAPNGMVTEYPFAKMGGSKRRYRFDLAMPGKKIALEVHGGAYIKRQGGGIGGAHHSIEGRARDMAKGNLAAVMGWIVIEVSPKELSDGTAFHWIEEALEARKVLDGCSITNCKKEKDSSLPAPNGR